jgi:hypothetical protein
MKAMSGPEVLRYKDGDQGPLHLLPRPPTAPRDGANGRFSRLPVAGLPAARHGEPLRLMIDLDAPVRRCAPLTAHGGRLIVAIRPGRRFSCCRGRGLWRRPAPARVVLNLPEGRARGPPDPRPGRPCREHRPEPQDAGLPSGRAARDGARQGRAAPGLQGWRSVGPLHARPRRRLVLGRDGRADAGASPTSPNGWAGAGRPGGWRRGASRGTTASLRPRRADGAPLAKESGPH